MCEGEREREILNFNNTLLKIQDITKTTTIDEVQEHHGQ